MDQPPAFSTRMEYISVENLLRNMKTMHIDTDDFFRLYTMLNHEEGERFISSLLAGIPVSPLTFDGSRKPWKVLDGRKRLSLIEAFYNNRFLIGGDRFIHLTQRSLFSELPYMSKRRFMTARIPCYVVNPGSSAEAIHDFKERIQSKL